MAIDARNRSLPDWFTRIRTRQLMLPRFQRHEAWGYANVTQLFNTILQDLPIGAVLVLEIGNEEPFISRTLKGAPSTGEKVNEHLLDGQQRLTALWRGLNNNYEYRTYFLYMSPEEDTGMPYYVDSIARWKQQGDPERRPFYANKPAQLWFKKRAIALDLCLPEESSLKRFKEWARESIPDRDEREEVTEQIFRVRSKLHAFNLPYLSLPVTTNPDTALDVFIRMNTSAEELSIYDIVVAQVEASMGESLHDLVSDTRKRCPTIAEYYSPEELTLYAGALLQSKLPANSTYRSKTFGTQLLDNWESFFLGVSRTVAFLEEERVFDAARLPTDIVVPVLVAAWASAPQGLDAEGRARHILRKYLWRAFFSSRYEKSTASRSLDDYSDLTTLIEEPGAAQPRIFDDEQYPVARTEELMLAGWPKNKNRLARAILALALKQGGLDLADGSAASRDNLVKREYHHIFPYAYLKRMQVLDEKIDVSLNCALITWQTNRTISDKEPKRYLAERSDGTYLTESELRARLSSHVIPYEEMVMGDYNGFIEKRAELVYSAVTELCESDVS